MFQGKIPTAGSARIASLPLDWSSSEQRSPTQILVCDNDAPLRNAIVAFLESRNCCVHAAPVSQDLVRQVGQGLWSLILLDISPAGDDGFEQLRSIRRVSDVPILITGHNLSSTDRIVALEFGADGSIDKPFDMHEFWAQARALERRQRLARDTARSRRDRGGFRFSGWTLTFLDRTVTDPDGRAIKLSRASFALLLAFLEAPGRVLSRAHLMRATHAREDIFDRSVDVQVMRLRRVIERDRPDRPCIRAERGIGYVFDAAVERLH